MQNPFQGQRSEDEGAETLRSLGGMDIYLLDQMLKGRIDASSNILDAGCGTGRNVDFMLRHGYTVAGVDRSPAAIAEIRRLAEVRLSEAKPDLFRVEAVEHLSFEDEHFDVVVCNAVLHFANDEEHFTAMVNQLWRVLRPGGMLFARLASSIGIEGRIEQVGERTFLLPDGTERFLVDEAFLLRHTQRLGAALLEPIKTINVQGMRCMTNWVLTKPQTQS